MARSSEPLVVIAWWQTSAASLERVLALAAELREASLAEPGCLGYEILQRVGEPGSVVLIERYAGEEALEAHRLTAHYRELLVEGILPELTARRLELLRPENEIG